MKPLRQIFDLAVRYWNAKKGLRAAARDLEHLRSVATTLRTTPREIPTNLKNLMLVNAAAEGNPYLVSLLLSAGADVHAMRDIALVLAVASENCSTVDTLIDAGADVHAFDDGAFRIAEESGDRYMISILNNRAHHPV